MCKEKQRNDIKLNSLEQYLLSIRMCAVQQRENRFNIFNDESAYVESNKRSPRVGRKANTHVWGIMWEEKHKFHAAHKVKSKKIFFNSNLSKAFACEK